MIRVVFYDFDDTLYSHRLAGFPAGTRDALAQLKRRGIRQYMCTGRSVQELRTFGADQLGLDGFLTLTGALAVDPQGKVLFGRPLGPEDQPVFRQLFSQRQMPIMACQADAVFINFDSAVIRRSQQALHSAMPPVRPYRGGDIYQFSVFSLRDEQEVLARMKQVKMANWFEGSWDFIHAAAGKASAIRQTLKTLGFQPQEAMAFGDGENDIEMMQAAGLGIAMGNASPQVKECADYVTADCAEDGLLAALRHFGLAD